MAVDATREPGLAPDPGDRVGVIDVGSNSIRLVVYEGHPRAPIPVFNEKVLCGLGRSLANTGRLDPEGVAMALDNLARFAELARVMAFSHLDVVATAAVRDAEDGPAFVDLVRARCGFDVRVLSGAQEAEFSALGVISGIPGADGLMGDIGAGSLELARLGHGKAKVQATLPLGPFRLGTVRRAQRRKVVERVNAAFEPLDWLSEGRDRTLYLVGGNWRALGRIHMAQHDYPLRMIHCYTLSRREALPLAELVSGLSPSTLSTMEVVPRRRQDTVPTAALVLEQLILKVRPKQIVFSADGLREGVLYGLLPPAVRAQDPLIEGCLSFTERLRGSTDYGRALNEWTAPLFPEETPEQARLRLAGCILADVAWREHPDYRAAHAFQQILRLQVVGVDHPGRAFMAVAVAARHDTAYADAMLAPIVALIEASRRNVARRLGLAIRLADSLSGVQPEALARTSLQVTDETLVLRFQPGAELLVGEVVERRLRTLAQFMELDPVLGPRRAP